MPLPIRTDGSAPYEGAATYEDYWGLPEDRRAELINGTLYDMAPPSRVHQRLSNRLSHLFTQYVLDKDGACEVYAAPFSVCLELDRTDWVEPDISIICDPAKLTDRGCCGAPDLVVEIASPSSLRVDYLVKPLRYERAGVRELWIVNPATQRTVTYRFDADGPQLSEHAFDEPIPVGIWDDELLVTMADLL